MKVLKKLRKLNFGLFQIVGFKNLKNTYYATKREEEINVLLNRPKA